MVFVISLLKTGFIFDNNMKGLIKGLVSWGLFVGSSFNGSPDSVHMTSGAHWTLRYEWLFYLSLPAVAAIFNRRWYGKYLALSVLIMILAIPGIYLGLVVPKLALLFLIGFTPVIININFPEFSSLAKSRTASLVVLAFIVSGMLIDQGYSILQMLVLGVAFIMIALGNTIFGVLGSKGLKTLGEVSYSIYLIHGLILYMLFSVFNVFSFENDNALHYIALLPIVLALVSAVSVLTFSTIEKPFIFVRDKKLTALP
jgi:peptidoglycan/LPS O-acetylase OafA/YrhL